MTRIWARSLYRQISFRVRNHACASRGSSLDRFYPNYPECGSGLIDLNCKTPKNFRRNFSMKKKLSLSQKILRLRTRMQDPEWRRYGRLLLVGKLLGVGLLIGLVAVLPELLGFKAFAADAE